MFHINRKSSYVEQDTNHSPFLRVRTSLRRASSRSDDVRTASESAAAHGYLCRKRSDKGSIMLHTHEITNA